jgi:hypothetical protein
VKRSEALSYGSAFHAAMGHHYEHFNDPDKRMQQHLPYLVEGVANAYIPDPEPTWLPEGVAPETDSLEYKRSRFQAHVMAYVDHYQPEWFEESAFIEYEFEVPLFYSKVWGLKGILDGLVRDSHGYWWLFEHKTAAGIDLGTLGALSFDFQTTYYLMACRLMHKRSPRTFPDVKGVLYNVSKKPQWRPKKVWDTVLESGEVFTGTKGAGSAWAKEQRILHDAKEFDPGEYGLASQIERRETPTEFGKRCHDMLLEEPGRYFVRDWVIPNEDLISDFTNLLWSGFRDMAKGPKYHNPKGCQFCQYKVLCASPRDAWDEIISTEFTLRTGRRDVIIPVDVLPHHGG